MALEPIRDQDQWARLIAAAWRNETIMNNLREDPKAEIERLKELPETDPDYPGDISDIGSIDAGGYFALPEQPEGLEDLDKEKLVEFLAENPGIFGIMRWCCI